jgi:hypothetical protein
MEHCNFQTSFEGERYEKYEKNRLDSYSQIECVPDLGIDIMTFTVSEDNMWKVINTDYLKELMNSLKQEYDYIISAKEEV